MDMTRIEKSIAELQSNRRRNRWGMLISALACITVLCTVYALMVPAFALVDDETATCGFVSHTHSESCYENQKFPAYTCLGEMHMHSDECYDEDGNLICGKADYVIHSHTASCYDDKGVLYCPLPEVKLHEHTDACYEIEAVLFCGLEEGDSHTHSAACYKNREVLVCPYEQAEYHIHTEDCYDENGEPVCDLTETTEAAFHQHDDSCYDEQGNLICGHTEILIHQHSDTCIKTESHPVLVCGIPEHVHGDACASSETVADASLSEAAESSETTEDVDASASAGNTEKAAEQTVQKAKAVSQSVKAGSLMLTASGTLNDRLTWEIRPDSDGTYALWIDGTGAITSSSSAKFKDTPGIAENIDDIVHVYIGSGITSVGSYAFHECSSIRTVEFAEGSQLTSIGTSAFSGCSGLISINLENCRNLTTINGYALYLTNVEYLQIPNTVKTIGDYAFAYMNGLKEVYFEENYVLNSIGQYLFGGNSGNNFLLTKINLENLKNPDITVGPGMFSWADTLPSVIIPSGFSGTTMLNNLVYGDTKLTELIFMPNSHTIGGNGAASIWSSALTTLDYRPLSAMTSVMLGSKHSVLESIYFPASITAVYQGYSCQELTLISFEPGTKMRYIGNTSGTTGAFYSLDSLQELDFSNFVKGSNPLQIHSSIHDNKALKRAMIPVSAGEVRNSYYNLPALEDFLYDAENLTTLDPLASGNLLTNCGNTFTLTIGKNVDVLNPDFLTRASQYCKDVLFAGENTFSITGVTENYLSEPLNELDGDYYVDSCGALYKLKQGRNAELVYVPPYTPVGDTWDKTALEAYTVPTEISVDGTTYNVMEMNRYSMVEARNLTSLNGNTTLEDAQSYLAGRGFGDVELDRTHLTNAEHISAFPEGGTQTTDILTVTDFEEGQEGTTLKVNTSGFDLLTNEVAGFVLSMSNTKQDSSKIGRIYFAFSEPDYSAFGGIPLDKTQSSTPEQGATFYYTLHRVPGTDIFYMDMGPIPVGATGSMNFNPYYTSPNTPGGKLKIWAELIDDAKQAPNITLDDETEFHQIEWTTDPDTFTVAKSKGSNAKLQKIADDYFINGLNFNLALTRDGDTHDYGKNLIDTVDFTDVMTLPAKACWRSGLVDAVKAGDVRSEISNNGKSATLYVSINSVEYQLAKVTAKDIYNLTAEYDKVADNIVLHWSVKNVTPNYEYEMGTGNILYGNEVLQLVPGTSFDGSNVTVNNDVACTINYQHPHDPHYTSSSADASVALNKGDITFTKSRSARSGFRWGEDMTYSITTANSTLFPYDGVNYATDSLNSIYYIKPANMAKMFAKDEFKELSITIKNATLCSGDFEQEDIITVDGRTHSITSIRNSSSVAYYEGMAKTVANTDNYDIPNQKYILIIRWDTDGEHLAIDYGPGTKAEHAVNRLTGIEPTAAGIDAALESLQYLPTTVCQYTCTWQYNQKGSTRSHFEAGESRKETMYVTFKDTFLYLKDDHNNIYGSGSTDASYGKGHSNQASLDVDGKTAAMTAKLSSGLEAVNYDIELDKDITKDGKAIGTGNLVRNDDIVDNSLTVNHYGKGTYDLLPIVDRMTGVQFALAKCSDNTDASWKNGLDSVTYKMEDYYILTAGTYEGVWLGGYYADSVTVTQDNRGNVDTLVKWYLADTLPKDYTVKINYPSLISCERAGSTDVDFYTNNKVWLGDHPSHRLYDSQGIGGTRVEFSKWIEKNNAGVKTYEKDCPVSPGETITYQLRFTVHGSGVISGKDFFDALPNVYNEDSGDFVWTKDNVKIESYVFANGHGSVTLPNGNIDDSYSVTDVSPDDGQTRSGQYYIKWDDSFKANFTEGDVLYVTVKLTFPTGEKWDVFSVRADGNLLENTLWFKNLPDTVYHNLALSVKARLQKGVYDTLYLCNNSSDSSGSTNIYNDGPVVLRDNPLVYVNDGAHEYHRVAYYVELYNDGPGKLFLNPIEDVLPQGYTFYSLAFGFPLKSGDIDLARYDQFTPGSGYALKTGLNDRVVGSDGWVTFKKGTAVPLSKAVLSDSTEPEYVVANIRATVASADSNGVQKLKFNVTGDLTEGSECKLSYDEVEQKWYLKPGECLRFGYVVRTNTAEKTLDNSNNAVAMPIYSPYTSDVTVCDSDSVLMTSTSDLAPNNGDCELYGNARAANKGMTGTSPQDKWLFSEVAVKRSVMVPGINVQDKYIEEAGSSHIQRKSDGNMAGGETALWNIKATNSGDAPLIGYTITDAMQTPFQFTGPVYLDLWDESNLVTGTYGGYTQYVDDNGNPVLDEDGNVKNRHPLVTSGNKDGKYASTTMKPLFTIVRGDDPDVITVISVDSDGKEHSRDLHSGDTFSDLKTTLYMHNGYNTGSAYASQGYTLSVTWTRDNKGNETLSVDFPDSLGIPANGSLELLVGTKEVTDVHVQKSYVNQAWITPTQEFDGDDVGLGNYVSYGGKPSVVDSEPVNVVSGYTTASTKKVTEVLYPDNYATTDSTPNWILLKNEDSLFDYTLTVYGPDSYDMDKLVIIDNLPEKNDHNTFAKDIPRNSAFKVLFNEDPNVRVTLDGAAASNYILQYSNATEFDSQDWAGDDSEKWFTAPDPSTLGSAAARNAWYEKLANARSIRLIMNNVAKGTQVDVSFTCKVFADEAEPSSIAWNNFGYNYTVEGTSLQASPAEVGVQVPSVPKLKKVIELDGQPDAAIKDLECSFCVYQGDAIEELERYVNNQSLLRSHLLDAKRKYIFVDTTVEEGFSEAENVKMMAQNFWVDGEKYTILELDKDSDYMFVNFDGHPERSFTFTYQNDKKLTITAVNSRSEWNIELLKTDLQNDRIKGAVFGLYSPNIEDQSDDIEPEYANLSYEGTRYYFMDRGVSDDNGIIRFSKLYSDDYVVMELYPPDGFITDSEPIHIERTLSSTVYRSVINEPAPLLPQTGGSGIDFRIYGLALLTFIGILLFLGNQSPRKKRN